MTPPPPISTLFPYTTLFRSLFDNLQLIAFFLCEFWAGLREGVDGLASSLRLAGEEGDFIVFGHRLFGVDLDALHFGEQPADGRQALFLFGAHGGLHIFCEFIE